MVEFRLLMRLIQTRLFLICCLAMAISMETMRAETPTQAVDRIWNAAFDEKSNFYSAEGIWALSKEIAHEQGVEVIAPILARSQNWKSEEILVFIPVVYFLPQEKAIPVLKQFQLNGKPWEQQCATDLLHEITEHANDLKQMEIQAEQK